MSKSLDDYITEFIESAEKEFKREFTWEAKKEIREEYKIFVCNAKMVAQRVSFVMGVSSDEVYKLLKKLNS